MSSYEINFDGLVGPSHNYAGLSSGNVASTSNAGDVSNPKAAAHQGLKKAKALHDLGFKQGILAPHERPAFETLRRIGFNGSDEEIIEKAGKKNFEILAACYSSSAMWTANAATIAPSADTRDGKVHVTPANLSNKFHRSIEPFLTGEILKRTLPDPSVFSHHLHLPEGGHFGDEGAANHTRFCAEYGRKGVQLFVFGRHAFREGMPAPKKFPVRQTLEASEAIARLHQLNPEKTLFAQQNPAVIDGGVFHNDVISVGNKNVYFYHEDALLDSDRVLEDLRRSLDGTDFHAIKVSRKQVSVQDAVSSYLFNSQLLSLPDGGMMIVVPEECRQNKAVWDYLQELTGKNTPIRKIQVFNVTESMKNGGGPACLRLRVALKESEIKGVNPHTLLDENLYKKLYDWVDKHYRDQLKPRDLLDPHLVREIKTALDELTQILNLGALYSFQH